MAVLEFFWEKSGLQRSMPAGRSAGIRLSDDVLLRNASWFITLRWIVVAFLCFFQSLSLLLENGLNAIGIHSGGYWPLVVAFILGAANIWYSFTLKKAFGHAISPAVNIWTQITVDLLCLSVVVHFLGSTGNPAPFLYVIHIVLAGVFLSTEASSVVLAMAVVLSGTCVTLESVGIVSQQSVLAGVLQQPAEYGKWTIFLQEATKDVLFFLVWYMVAQLTTIIRLRENQLIEADAQTRRIQKEKDRYAMQMTHQLKSPLDAIRSNTSLILKGYCGQVTDDAADVLRKIESRAKSMGELIMDVLKLSRVNSVEEAASPETVDIGALLGECVEDLRGYAHQRGIVLSSSLTSALNRCVVEQIRMLFENVLTNAISYSYAGGTVDVRCGMDKSSAETAVVVADSGIGIAEEQLPHIFDEYFRTKEAHEYNRASSGIGLAIVKRVAQNHGLRLSVASAPKLGTKFSVYFPPMNGEAEREMAHSTAAFSRR
jgi:two-component system, OmpR family, phosphate regulon sensor histidine kinase PhoR